MQDEQNNIKEAEQLDGASVPKSKRYRKDKPWDNDPTVDKWKIPQINPEEVQPFSEESSFVVLFPEYREKYIKECYGFVKKKLMEYGVKFELNLLEGSMTVRTTKKTWDPFAIIKARDVIKLISRSVPYLQALRLMEDGVFCDVIKIKSLVRNTDKFVKRRQRLIGPNGATLKALELLTECYILVQGSTVCVIGSIKNIKVLRRIVVDTMQNVHPIYHIKELMIKRELMKDEAMKEENWDRFLPKFKELRQKRKKAKKVIKKKKEYDPFPPAQQPRKEDLLMESGQYFLAESERKRKALEAKKARQQARTIEKQQEKEKQYEQPDIQEEIEREQARDAQRKTRNLREEESLDDLKKKFLTKPIKKIKF